MSDIALDRELFVPGAFTEWYRERPFQIAFAASVLIHALLIAFVPGLRSVRMEAPPVLSVEIVTPEEQRPVVREALPRAESQPDVIRQPEFTPPLPEVRPVEQPPVVPEPVVEPQVRPVEPEIAAPVQRAELSPPVAREIPRPEPITLPRPDPLAEQRVQIPVEPRPTPEARPVAPPPVARIEPRPEPQAPPRPEPRPQFLPEPPARELAPAPPAPRAVAPATVQPRAVEPVLAPPPVQPSPAPTVAIQAQPPVAAPVPLPSTAAVVDSLASELTVTYSQQISTRIKRYQKYPPIAQRRGWEGTAEVLLRIAPDGRVTEIALGKSTGRDVLDREALEMVRRASPLPQAPEQLRGRALSVTVPIIFRLQDS